MEKWSDPPHPLILSKKSITFGHKKVSESYGLAKTPPSPLTEKFRKKTTFFDRNASLTKNFVVNNWQILYLQY